MWALIFNEASHTLSCRSDHPEPIPGPEDALIRVLRAGICSTDVEITRGYVPGFAMALGHEFVGQVVQCASRPQLVGCRVVGEINCNDAGCSGCDVVFQRNHAVGRSVLGIIGREGSLAEMVSNGS